MKKRHINFRPIFVAAVMFALGILLAHDILRVRVGAIVFFVLTLAAFLAWTIIAKKAKIVLTAVCAFVVGMSSSVAVSSLYLPKDFDSGQYACEARVESVVRDESTYQLVILDKVNIDGDKQRRNVVALISSADAVSVGDIIEFKSYVDKVNMWNLGEWNSYYYKNKIGFTTTLKSSEIKKVGSKLTVGDKVRLYVKNILYSNMIDDNASIAYAAVFGDKCGVDTETKNAFSNLGVAHLLAISGLHVGFFVLVIVCILKKCGLNQRWHILVVLPILLGYCYLCGFSPSVLRATIMTSVLMLARAVGRKNDSLTTISIALVILLLIKPMLVFDGGTQLSFLSVYSLILLAPPIEKCLKRIGLKKMARPLAAVVAVEIGTMPVIAKMFGHMSLLSIATNMICLPIFEVAYILLMCLLPLVMIIPSAGIVLIAPEFLINTICFAVLNLNKFSQFTIASSYPGRLFTICYIFVLFGLSRFVFGNLSFKSLAVISLVFVCAVVIGVQKITFSPKSQSVCSVADADCFVVVGEKENYLVDFSSNFEDVQNSLFNYLNYNNINSIDNIISVNNKRFDGIYHTQKSNIISVEEKEDVNVFKVDGVTRAISLRLDGKNLCFLHAVKAEEMSAMTEFFDGIEFDLIISDTNTLVDLCAKHTVNNTNNLFSTNWTISYACDTLGIKRSLD